MTYGKLLTPLIFLAATSSAFGSENHKSLSTTTKLEGVCLQEGGGQVAQFVLVQDILGGLESKPVMLPGAAARVTIDYETATNGGKFYHARFSLFSFNGDLAVLEDRKVFEWLDHEQVLEASLQTKKGAKLTCIANVLNAN